jgi:hypothetical protein
VLSSGQEIHLSRRDLFDARFQLISESEVACSHGSEGETDGRDAGNTSTPSALEFLDAPSDLLPGIYEGGLKTWECSSDLAQYLHAAREKGAFDGARGKRIVEVSHLSLFIPHQFTLTPELKFVGRVWHCHPVALPSSPDVLRVVFVAHRTQRATPANMDISSRLQRIRPPTCYAS